MVLRQQDVRTDTFRASGPGGQHRNKTDSGVRLTHLPSGVVVTATEDRSQHRNRAAAWERLRSALTVQAEGVAHARRNQERADDLGAHRTFSWTEWRDEVRTPSGGRASMRVALKGHLRSLVE